MNHSMAHPHGHTRPLDLPGWKTALSVGSAVVLAFLFIVAGVWKITDPLSWSQRLTQLLVPHFLSLPGTLLFGISETLAGVLLLVPRYRRWGAWLTGVLLLAFMAYAGINYSALRGAECSCFPWVERAIGPAFFVGDFAMLVLAVVAGWWAVPSRSLRGASLILAAVAVFAGMSYGVTAVRETGVRPPDTITADGKPLSLAEGRIFLYFYDPECMHCDKAARAMSKYNWKDTKVVSIAIAKPHFADEFLRDTGLRSMVSNDAELLRQTFKFLDSPYGVALEDGRQKAPITNFDGDEPGPTLRKLGFIE